MSMIGLNPELGIRTIVPRRHSAGLFPLACTYDGDSDFLHGYVTADVAEQYNYFRDYDPAIGRYVQSDPVGIRAGMNTYSYVLSNPITGIDPRGLIVWDGEFKVRTFALGFAYFVGDFELTSRQCEDGFKTKVKVGARGLGFSFGIPRFKPSTRSPGGEVNGTVVFDDGRASIDPYVFAGDLHCATLLPSIGPVGLDPSIILGGMPAEEVDANAFSFGLSLQDATLVGSSAVDGIELVPCSCE